MKEIRGPAIFLAQFLRDEPPYDRLDTIADWVASLGYKGIQVPSNDARCIDLDLAAESQDYCDELAGRCAERGLAITELSTHLQGQLVAVHPAYDELFDAFAPAELHGKPAERQAWAVEQMEKAAIASRRLGLKACASFSGALMWHLVYPWPQRPAGLVEAGFAELAKRWRPILDVYEDNGIDVAFEIHPGEDLHDGASFETFLEAVDFHPRANILYDPSHFVLQQLDYLGFIDRYHERIKAFHVKDAEFRPDARTGVYGGYRDWAERAGRFRSLGDGQVDFRQIFSKLTHYGFDGWAVLEWECCFKHPEQGAAEGAPFIADHIIRPTPYAFDDFAGGSEDEGKIARALGIEN
ncbi:sugar phosphate isomerase/epimerase family protein [Qipengyuania flava]|uniref:sugar phosphate isomerase/epimerase family protein n=1 Tax=Qipengyuania flava TaxID=192812 RepID=UPI001C62BE14|nr:sugar phosphate isomerase/epimerase family protein [Qipengyuania flava]QYJ07738.1 sugar phosphate isomerase/epimerase [Qipengyuania flava]